MRRYTKDNSIAGGKLSTAKAVRTIRRAHELGFLTTRDIILTESERLEHVVDEYLGDSGLWWVLAALSNIGWAMQLPPGTIIKIPQDIGKIATLVGG